LLPICLVALYRYIPVPITPLMLTRNIDEGTPINYTWTPIEKISPNLVQAVVASEDNLFMEHDGFDFKQIEIARREAEAGKRLRGASTITQQTAKNLFLWQGRSWLRKGLEAYFTVLMEQLWSKKRIMEAYLNCIEMGDGIYGAAAVAKINFNTTPDKLTKEQCALIAATLPNPRKFNSAKPSKYMKQRQNAILKNMKNIGPIKFE
jgi:monofunctional biosynthetic peptidoglycan transglycosylase